MSETIVVYTTGPQCAQCTMTKRVLATMGVEFREVDIRDDEGAREYVTEELGYSQAPIVVVDEQDHWSGFRPDQLQRLATR